LQNEDRNLRILFALQLHLESTRLPDCCHLLSRDQFYLSTKSAGRVIAAAPVLDQPAFQIIRRTDVMAPGFPS
jgi:2-methylisocitrate lyase-like PEP mutase family enzyme